MRKLKLLYCIRLLLHLATCLFSLYVYAETVNESLPSTPTHPRERLVKVNSLKELPEEIVYLLNKEVGKVADINEYFNQSDMITDLNASRQGLREARLGKDSAVLTIARGGFVLRFIELTFYKDEKGWQLLKSKDEASAYSNKDTSSKPATEYVIKEYVITGSDK